LRENKDRLLLFIKNSGFGIASFGIYIVAQQIFIMPALSKMTTDIEFSNLILFITIFNILCMVIGEELGNTKLVQNKIYVEKNISGDFGIILTFLLFTVYAICFLITFLFKIGYENIVLYVLLFTLGITRFFLMSYFKINQQFNEIFIVNLFYFIGSFLGIFLVITFNLPLLAPFILGEIFSLFYAFFKTKKIRKELFCLKKTAEFKNTTYVFIQLGFVALIINSISYLDRVVIYPILGAVAMGTYYAASSMSKMISLIINPISSVLLARLSTSQNLSKEKMRELIFKFFMPIFLPSFFGSMVLTYIGVYLLYNKYLEETVPLLIPISLSTSLAVSSFLIKPVIMTFFKTKYLVYSNIFYAVTFCLSMYFFSVWWGMTGFAWASALGRIAQFTGYILIVFNKIKR
jgi:O-antigen/teichoic acid export membrane protein